MKTIRKTHGIKHLIAGGSLAALLAMGGLAPPASASRGNWEAILGGHVGSSSEARHIASQAQREGFRAYVHEISSHNYEAEIFNGGGSRSDAEAVCARARRAGGLPHCSAEQEFHGNGWSRS